MAKLITFGKYYHKYKFILIYIATITPFYYLYFSDNDIRIPFLKDEHFPKVIVVYEIFRFFGKIIFGIIFYKIELGNILSGKERENMEEEEKNDKFKLIVYEERDQIPAVSIITMFLLLSPYLISFKLGQYLCDIGFFGLDLYMTELLFVILSKILFFNTIIYLHQKLAIFVYLFFPIILEITKIIIIFQDDKGEIFVKYPWTTALVIFLFLLIYFCQGYIVCKLKYYFDLRFISESKILIIFGLLGTMIFLLWSLIANFIECKNDTFSETVCQIHDDKSLLYFDNFIVFFKNIWKEDRSDFINVMYILLMVIKIALSAFQFFLAFLIIKVLGPEYYILSETLVKFILNFIHFIYYIFSGKLTLNFGLSLLAELFCVFGISIYLELIELNFCGLNKNISKNINLRAEAEALEMFKQEDDDKSDEDEKD